MDAYFVEDSFKHISKSWKLEQALLQQFPLKET